MTDVRAALDQTVREVFPMSNEPQPPTAIMTGTQLGPYEIIGLIGRGGLGEIWKARDTRLGRLVVIKRLTAVQHMDVVQQAARKLAALNHPYICQLYDVGPDYLVLEHIEGYPMRPPLALGEAVRLALQIAAALEEAHSKGILHSDLKPAAVILTKDGSVKLVDFALSRGSVEADAGTTPMADAIWRSTVAYMAPEQAEGQPLDARADVFSFGALTYEMLSGTRAFSGTTTDQVREAVLRSDPAPLDDIPHALDVIMRRCLAKDAGQRFQTMTDVRTALDRAARDILPQGQASIAVLPFTNMSRSPDDEYFGDGLAEEVTNLLARVPNLKIAARTSAFAFRGKEQDIRRIAESLGVQTILEGSVRRAGSRIRVTAQLINAENGYHLWSERYDRELTDVFAIQDEIAQAIAAALEVSSSSPPDASSASWPAKPSTKRGVT
jgi:TolB-like protein